MGLAERAHGLVLEPREQALGVKEVATCRDAAGAVELVSANRAARAHRAGRRTTVGRVARQRGAGRNWKKPTNDHERSVRDKQKVAK